jgi:hypothetical protein
MTKGKIILIIDHQGHANLEVQGLEPLQVIEAMTNAVSVVAHNERVRHLSGPQLVTNVKGLVGF